MNRNLSSDIPVYFPTIQKLGQQYKDKIKVLTGIELGLQPHLAAKHQELISRYDFDFVIGSSHVIHGKDPYYSRFFEGKTEQQAYQEYFESILENLAVFDNFDVYGHIDYVVRYGPNRNLEYSYQKYADVIDAILEKLIDMGKGIEINTGGFKYGLGHPNPTEDIIKRYHELGGEIITIGADAHKPEHVAFDFAKVPDILKAVGFQYFTVFEKEKTGFSSVVNYGNHALRISHLIAVFTKSVCRHAIFPVYAKVTVRFVNCGNNINTVKGTYHVS